MVELNVHVDHVTIWRWIQDYAPELSRRCRRELRNTNGSWRVDETYLRVAGTWTYLYRAVDSTGDTIDFLLSSKRDSAAAKAFVELEKAGLIVFGGVSAFGAGVWHQAHQEVVMRRRGPGCVGPSALNAA